MLVDCGEDDGNDDLDTGELREQDRFLPIANVARIMKKAIPSQVNFRNLKQFSVIFRDPI